MKKVLIVEDESFLRDIYQMAFERKGPCEVTLATNGREALALLKEQSYDAILLDIMMPEMDGIALLSYLEEEPLEKEQGPIFLLTNLDSSNIDFPKLVNKQRHYPIFDHIVKLNIEPRELVQRVMKAA